MGAAQAHAGQGRLSSLQVGTEGQGEPSTPRRRQSCPGTFLPLAFPVCNQDRTVTVSQHHGVPLRSKAGITLQSPLEGATGDTRGCWAPLATCGLPGHCHLPEAPAPFSSEARMFFTTNLSS